MLVAALLVVVGGKQLPFCESDQGDPVVHLYPVNCDPHLDSYCHDLSLEQAAKNATECSNVYIGINITQLQLDTAATFSRLESLTLDSGLGPNVTATVNCSRPNAGLVFKEITRLTINNLIVTNCGILVVGPHKVTLSSGITILNGRDVKANSLNILKSKGIGLTILDHQGGLVQIESSKFLRNSLPQDYNISGGGGGVFIGGFEQNPSEPITFNFDNCIFEQNIAHTKYYHHLYTDDLGQPVSGYGLGGGAAILLERDLTDIHATFSGCMFLKNEALLGGGLVSMIGAPDSESRNISVRVEDSLFEENGCSSSNPTASGGGIHINFTHSTTTTNQFIIHNVTFHKNCATYSGGGLRFYSYSSDISRNNSNAVEIDKCRFEGNRAHTGSAIVITPSVTQYPSNSFLVIPVFRNCMFLSNTVIHTKSTYTQTMQYGISTLYVRQCSIKLEGHNNFEDNIGTAIHIINGIIDMFKGNVLFSNNTAHQGGAVALIGESLMIVGPNRSYEFLNNTALDKGGALYVQTIDNHDITTSKTCFIQYYDGNAYIPARSREWNTMISFTGNRAHGGLGHAIFATSLYSCQTANTSVVDNPQLGSINTSNIFRLRGIVIEKDQPLNDQQVATEGVLLYHTGQNECAYEVIPGKEFSHNVTFTDELGNQPKRALTASIHNNSNIKIDTMFSSCITKQIILKGKPGEIAAIHFHAGTMTSRLYTQLTVKLVDCPVGFVYNEISSKCVCNHQEYIGLIECDTTTFQTHIVYGYWIGLIENSMNKSKKELVTSYCPLNFCNYNNSDPILRGSPVRLPRMNAQLNEAMCGKSRTGTVCGSCGPGYTTHFHSPNFRCKPVNQTLCKVGWLFYILSELVPVTVVFITVLAFNISFTSGFVNGFILFSQLLDSFYIDVTGSGHITLPTVIIVLRNGHKFIYGLLSLDFFQIEALSFCLWPNASALDVQAFKYVTIVYALLLVILVIWLTNKCGARCLGKWWRITTIKSSVIHGISAFLILCYSQCVRTSLKLLNDFPMHAGKGSSSTVSRRVWLNGNIVSFSGKHLHYALPALFCLLTIGIFPPALLLVYPLFNKVLTFFGLAESRLVKLVSQKVSISSLKPLLDSFQGCFKDNLRFFAGLYFLYRWTAPVTAIAPLSGFSRFYTAMEALFIVMLALHALCQPYAQKGHNMVDTLLFADLTLINSITFLYYSTFHSKLDHQIKREFIIAATVIQLVLIYLPLLIMTMYVAVLVCRLGCKRHDISTSSIQLSKLREFVVSINRKDSAHEEELPHQLIGSDVVYEQF